MASVTIRVDEQTKRDAAEIVVDFGFDLSSVTRAFYRQIVREGNWLGSHERHVANAGDWLLIWRSNEAVAAFQRTGLHDELFR